MRFRAFAAVKRQDTDSTSRRASRSIRRVGTFGFAPAIHDQPGRFSAVGPFTRYRVISAHDGLDGRTILTDAMPPERRRFLTAEDPCKEATGRQKLTNRVSLTVTVRPGCVPLVPARGSRPSVETTNRSPKGW